MEKFQLRTVGRGTSQYCRVLYPLRSKCESFTRMVSVVCMSSHLGPIYTEHRRRQRCDVARNIALIENLNTQRNCSKMGLQPNLEGLT